MKKAFRRGFAYVLTCVMLLGTLVGCGASSDGEMPTFRDLTWAVGTPLPAAEDFVKTLPDGYTVRFAEEYLFSSLGDYTLQLIVTDARGKETVQEVRFTLVLDSKPPVIAGLQDIVAYINGDGVSYRSGVSVSDNCDGEVSLSIDSSAVDLTRVGIYPAIYTATDAAGNSTVLRITVAVYEAEITEEMLNGLLDPVIDRIITDGMSLTQQLRAIYDYVSDSVSYGASSDKSSWVRAAYEGLRTGQGDCYTYFAISKAFFERLGIENMDIQRAADAVAKVDERHFWSLVNIGGAGAPAWYHFDACHLNDVRKPWGFLMTDAQLAEYTAQRVSTNGVTGYFYAYDTDAYPASATQIVTKIN